MTTYAVVAWSEMNGQDRSQICFRVVFWEGEGSTPAMGDIQTISDSVDLTYPAVSASYFESYAMSMGPEPEIFITVDLAYEKDRPNGDGQFIRYERYWGHPGGGEPYFSEFELTTAPQPMDVHNVQNDICRHPDIVYYSHPGQTVMCNSVETKVIPKIDAPFVVFECETSVTSPSGFFALIGWDPVFGENTL